jgi:dUTP pyrophosphatase
MSDEQQQSAQAPEPEKAPSLVDMLKHEVTEGFPQRMRKLAKLLGEAADGMSLGHWLEAAHTASHTGTVLASFSERALEFKDNYRPKLHGDAGVDIYLVEDAVLNPGEYIDLPSGVQVAMPIDWFAEVRARSSTSKRMVHVFPGVIDPGFTGEIKACVTNLGKEPITVKRGDRIAQLIFHKRLTPSFLPVAVEDLPKTERGERGFGSTNEAKS